MHYEHVEVLVVHSDLIDPEIVAEALDDGDRIRSNVIFTSSADHAIQLCHENLFDVVLIDYWLTEKSGLELLRQIETTIQTSPAVVLISDIEDERLAETAISFGAHEVLLRSEIQPLKLMRILRQARKRHGLEQALQMREAELRRSVRTDPLTGVNNRLGFDQLMSRCFQSGAPQEPFGLLVLDVDKFKTINDTLGHQAGDLVLVQVSQRLLGAVRDGDFVARMGGDEFVVVIPAMTEASDLDRAAMRIKDAFDAPLDLHDGQHAVTLSIGGARTRPGETAETEVLKRADFAMYRAKARGPGEYERFTETDYRQQIKDKTLTEEIGRGLQTDQFELFFQTLVTAQSQTVIGVEALLRWHHPEKGLLLPGKFLGVAAAHDLMAQIDDWVLDRATTQLRRWLEAGAIGAGAFMMAVNVSSARLRQPDFAVDVLDMLAAKAIDPGMLRLEVTEDALEKQSGIVAPVLQRLRAAGVRIALDDFGQGRSALRILRDFPIDCLKIHQDLVHNHQDLEDRAFLRAVLVMGKALGVQTVAEGVETMEQSRICQEFGADMLQGYFYNRPSADPELAA